MKRCVDTISLLLAALILVSCAEEAVSESGRSDGGNTVIPDNTAVGADSGERDEAKLAPDLPDDLSFDGDSFRFLSRHEPSGAWNVLDAYAEGLTGEVLNDAIFQRNEEVTERLGVVLTETVSENVPNDAKAAVLSGDTSYDALITNAVGSFSMASEGVVSDLYGLLFADLSRPWWDGAANEEYELFGHQYFAVSDMNLMANEATWITMANKAVLDDLAVGIDTLYDLVREGRWTIDAYRQTADLFYQDVNGNGKADSADTYGTVMQGHGADGFLMGCGLRWVEKDENGEPSLNPLDDRAAAIFDKVGSVVDKRIAFNSHDSIQNDKWAQDTEYGQQIFAEDRAVFFTETLQCVRRLRTMDTDFGVIPMPKFDETQETYLSMVHWWAMSMLSVPLNAPDPVKDGGCSGMDVLPVHDGNQGSLLRRGGQR